MKIISIIFGLVVFTFGIAFIFGFIMAFPTMWLWNFVVPHISNHSLPTIGFWQAWALNMLCSILFKSKSSSSSSSDSKSSDN